MSPLTIPATHAWQHSFWTLARVQVPRLPAGQAEVKEPLGWETKNVLEEPQWGPVDALLTPPAYSLSTTWMNENPHSVVTVWPLTCTSPVSGKHSSAVPHQGAVLNANTVSSSLSPGGPLQLVRRVEATKSGHRRRWSVRCSQSADKHF